jgi:dsDNA-specific endonuclease/ATPase MutS2
MSKSYTQADLETDMALQRRELIKQATQRRRALRSAVRLGLPPEIVNEVRRQFANHRAGVRRLREEQQACST